MSNAKPKTLKLDQIRIDGGTQIRTALNEATVAEYCEAYQDARDLPPVKVVWDGTHYWLWEGFHRWHARKRAGLADIKVESQDGTQRDAILLACGANSEHGLKRSNADKRKAVETLLADKEWGKKSDRWIADACGVSYTLVQNIRKETTDNIVSSKPKEGKDGKTRKAPEKKPAASPKQQVAAFFDGDKPKPDVREFKDTFKPSEFAPEVKETQQLRELNRSRLQVARDLIAKAVRKLDEVEGHKDAASAIVSACQQPLTQIDALVEAI